MNKKLHVFILKMAKMVIIDLFYEICDCHVNHFYVSGAFNKFPDFFVQAFEIVVDS